MPQIKKKSGKDQDVEQNRAIAAVGYLSILCLLPLLFKRESAFAQYHAKQGLVLVGCWIALLVIGIIPILGWLVFMVGSLAIFVMSIVGFANALMGEWWEVPYVGEWAKKINL